MRGKMKLDNMMEKIKEQDLIRICMEQKLMEKAN